MRTSLKLCTMKSLLVLNKNRNTQGYRYLLEVGEDNAKPRTKKITKVKIHQYSETKYGVFWHAEPKSGLSFGLALLLYRILASFFPNSYRFLPVCRQTPKARQSYFPEYTPLGIQILPSNLAQEQIEGICIRA